MNHRSVFLNPFLTVNLWIADCRMQNYTFPFSPIFDLRNFVSAIHWTVDFFVDLLLIVKSIHYIFFQTLWVHSWPLISLRVHSWPSDLFIIFSFKLSSCALSCISMHKPLILLIPFLIRLRPLLIKIICLELCVSINKNHITIWFVSIWSQYLL